MIEEEEVGDLWPKGKGVASTIAVRLELNLDPFQGFMALQLHSKKDEEEDTKRPKCEHKNSYYSS